jgi:glycosyltransferase involved in cell wall biosynthesis
VWSRFQESEGGHWLRRKLALKLERLAVRSADLVLVATPSDRDYLSRQHGLAATKLHVVPNPIDVTRFAPGRPEQRERGRVLYVGRLEPQKNVRALIDAFREVDGAQLLIVGDGSLRGELEERAKTAPVELAGSLPNAELPQLFRRAQVFVLPSLYEGSPKALLEAMACGLAVVAADSPAVREVVSTNENGILARPDPPGLAGALRVVLADDALRERLGKAARRYVVERHDQRAVSEKEARLLRALARSRRGTP